MAAFLPDKPLSEKERCHAKNYGYKTEPKQIWYYEEMADYLTVGDYITQTSQIHAIRVTYNPEERRGYVQGLLAFMMDNIPPWTNEGYRLKHIYKVFFETRRLTEDEESFIDTLYVTYSPL